MFDPLSLEEDPWFKEKVAEGEARGEIKAFRSMLLNIVRQRFPALSELAETKVAQINQPNMLNVLVLQIAMAPDEQTALNLLETDPPA